MNITGHFFLNSLFEISSNGEISITASEKELPEQMYSLLVIASDNVDPPRHSSGLLTVKFPPAGMVKTTPKVYAAGLQAEEDNLLTIIIGAVAGALAVVIIILIVYIVWRYVVYTNCTSSLDMRKNELKFHFFCIQTDFLQTAEL